MKLVDLKRFVSGKSPASVNIEKQKKTKKKKKNDVAFLARNKNSVMMSLSKKKKKKKKKQYPKSSPVLTWLFRTQTCEY